RYESHFHFCRPLADRPAWPAHASLHRLVRVHHLSRFSGVGLLHTALFDRSWLHLRIHRGSCDRAGGGHLGVHLRDLSESSSGRRTDARQLHPLDFRRPSHYALSEDGRGISARLYFLVLCRDDDASTAVGEDDGSGNEGRTSRADPTATGHRVASRPPPFSKLLPRLNQFLHGARWRESVAVDDAALAVRTFVELPHPVFAEKRQIAHDLFQIAAGPDLFLRGGVRAAGHDGRIYHIRVLFAFVRSFEG